MPGHPVGEKLEKPRQRMIAYTLLLIISFQSLGALNLFFE